MLPLREGYPNPVLNPQIPSVDLKINLYTVPKAMADFIVNNEM
jgi:hypothetical protein